MPTFKQNHFHTTSLDPRKAAQFYIDCFGAKFVEEVVRPDRVIVDLDLDGIPLRVSNRTGADDSMGELKLGFHHIGFEVDDLDKAAKSLKEKGVKFIVEPVSNESGNREAFVQSPDGIIFEIIQRK